MPMGISSGPAWFKRFIDLALRGFVALDALNFYMDDIILFTSNLDTNESDMFPARARGRHMHVELSKLEYQIS